MQAIKVFNLRGVDELVFFDVTATLQGRRPDFALIDELADDCFMPFTVGGGVRSIDDVRGLLSVGADKVALGAAAVEQPQLVREAAARFGSQCITAVIDVRRETDGRAVVWTRSATIPTDLDPVAFARQLEESGAGEIVVQSIDRDGTMQGYDIDCIEAVCRAVSVPVVASSGAGTYDDMVAAIRTGGASAVAAAAMFQFTQQTPLEAKHHLRAAGIPVRLPPHDG
jgi:cyclase